MNPISNLSVTIAVMASVFSLAPGVPAQTTNANLAGAAHAGKGKRVSEVPTSMREETLQAGPIHLTFCDGEIRYLYVGEKQIIRRVYFAVRDKNWTTAMPKFTRIEIERQPHGFTIHLEADCKTERTDYSWKGEITGTADGAIRFSATGAAGSNFDSQRIGLCVLYGSPELLKQTFELTDAAGSKTPGSFPQTVWPELVAKKYQTLRYVTESGMTVTTKVEGATFDMEDQRNYGDSSFKAYAPLPYPYPQILKGSTLTQTFTLHVEHAPTAHYTEKTNRIVLGALLPNAKIPQILFATPDTPDATFTGINFNRGNFKDKKSLTWGLNPAVHLPDDANFMDNTTAIIEQVQAAKLYSPDAVIHISPIRLDSYAWQAGRDPRGTTEFGAAWTARVVKYLALAGVADAAFDFPPGPAADILHRLQALAGHALYEVKIQGAGYLPIDALAFEENGQPRVWLINKTNQPQSVTLEKLMINLKPYEVREIERTK